MGVEERGDGRPSVLVADGEPEVGWVIGQLLREELGAEVVHAADAGAALVRARAHLPDLVITDVELPWTDGCALARALAADARTAGVPVLALSTAREDRWRAAEAGCRAFVAKPFDTADLVARARAILAVHHRQGVGSG